VSNSFIILRQTRLDDVRVELMAKNEKSSQLVDAMRNRRLMRFSRRFERGFVRGYVLDVGPKFFLLGLVSDRLWLDGFECFRVRDIRSMKPDPYGAFVVAALKARGAGRPKKPHVSLASVEELLLSSRRVFPLVAIHREEIRPEVCRIGRVLAVDRDRVSLLEINPDASWDAAPLKYRLSEITCVSFGGQYEAALHLVGGDPRLPRPAGRKTAR
jgi:hypothetical protein